MHFQENLLSLVKEDFMKDCGRSHLFKPKENSPRGAHQINFSSNQIQNQDKIQDYEKIYKEKYQVSQISLNKQKQENSLLKKQNERLKLVQGELLNKFKQKFLQQLKGLILSIKQIDQMYQSLSQRQNSYKYEIDKIINSVKKMFSNQLDSEKKFTPNIDRVKTLEKEVNLFKMQTIQKQNIIQKLQETLKQKQEQLKKVKTELNNKLNQIQVVNKFPIKRQWQDQFSQSSISRDQRQDSDSYSRVQNSSSDFTLHDKKNESFQRRISAEQSVQLKSKMETIFRFLSPIFCQNLSKKQKIIKQERINKIFNTNPDQTTLDHNLKYIAFCKVKNAQNQIIIFFNYAYSELRFGFAIFKQGFLEIKYESSNFEQQWTAKYESGSWKVKCIITSDESQCYSKQWICSQLVLLEL